MKRLTTRLAILLVSTLSMLAGAYGQSTPGSSASAQVPPPLIQFSNIATDEGGNTLSGVVNLTFSFYSSQQGGDPLWMETQNNVQLDPTGHYSVQLGITKPAGVPTTLFTTGEARWLGVQIEGQAQQPRVLLLSVPYALKAGDAATIGGLPPSAFVLAAPSAGSASTYTTESFSSQNAPPPSGAITGTGKVDYLPMWDTTSDIVSSVLFQSGTGSTAKIGINTTTPASTLDVKGGSTVRGTLSLPATGTATATKGANSQPLTMAASAYNSSTSSAVTQTFQWQAEPEGNDTSTATGSLNLLFGQGSSKTAETGLHIANNGQITFAAGQTFPGTGSGTVTSVGSGTGLTGGPITSSGSLSIATGGVTNSMLANPSLTVTAGADLTGGGAVALGGSTTLNLDTTKVPQLNAANTFTGTQTVNGNINATGLVSGSGFEIGSNLIAYGSYAASNAFLGYAGNTTTTGAWNTASGALALSSISTGTFNTATGFQSLQANTVGYFNTAMGFNALGSNTSGFSNTASGAGALLNNTTGTQNAALGLSALAGNTTGSDNTASGTSALLNNTTGGDNVAIGFESLGLNTTGVNNTALGAFSGQSGDSSYVTGASNTFIGYGAGPSTGTITNSVAIGVLAQVSENNALVLGPVNGVNGASINTLVGIGTTAPRSKLDIDDSVPSGLGPILTLTNNGGAGQVAIDFNTYPPSTQGIYNPAARIEAGDYGDYSDVIAFLANTPGAANQGLQTTMSIDPFGDVHVYGTLSKASGSFKIDHPLDPANKYLYHSFVESPDMKNIYDGNVTTNSRGVAEVVLPDYFEALNRDFRYQLTVIGQFAQAIVLRKIGNNRFTIKTSKPGVEVSWQVTGVRHDAYADAHRIQVEVEKAPQEQGHYLHPELFGAPAEQAIGYHPLDPSKPTARLQPTSATGTLKQ